MMSTNETSTSGHRTPSLADSRRSQASEESFAKAKEFSDSVSVDRNRNSSTVSTSSLDSKTPYHVSSVPCHISNNAPAWSESSRPWLNGYLRIGPLTGIFAMLCALGSLIASLGVLIHSDGASTASWPVEPSIYIAAFTAVANSSVRYACAHGVVITWWARAIRGSSVAKLHRDWSTGSTLHGALTAGLSTGLLGLACIFSTVVVIDGPLLQRATSVKSSSADTARPLTVTIAPEIPNSWSGVWYDWKGATSWSGSFNITAPTARTNHTSSVNITTENFARLADHFWADTWLDHNPIGSEFIEGCANSCKTSIRAPALATTNCRNSMIPFHPAAQNLSSFGNLNVAPPLTSDLFIIDLEFIPGSSERSEKVDLITAFRQQHENDPDCRGFLNMTVCTLESAIGAYDTTISGHTITLGAPSIVTLANNTRGERQWNNTAKGWNSTLAGINAMATHYWATGVSMKSTHDGTPESLVVGLNQQYLFKDKPESRCYSFRDPHEDVMQSLNELMFLTGIQATRYDGAEDLESRMDPGLSIHQQALGYPQGVFRSDYHWFAAAALVELICIAFVAPTYWGYWRLGRPLSMSPLETAKAFGSPILVDCNSNSSARDISKNVGDIRLQYGAVRTDQGTKLAFDSPERTNWPQRWSRYDV